MTRPAGRGAARWPRSPWCAAPRRRRHRPPALPADESALTVADLAAYRAALSAQGGRPTGPPVRGRLPRPLGPPRDVSRASRAGRGAGRPPVPAGGLRHLPAARRGLGRLARGRPVLPGLPRDPDGRADGEAAAPAGQVRFAGTFLKLVRISRGRRPAARPADRGARPAGRGRGAGAGPVEAATAGSGA